jgi:hypothetical protein
LENFPIEIRFVLSSGTYSVFSNFIWCISWFTLTFNWTVPIPWLQAVYRHQLQWWNLLLVFLWIFLACNRCDLKRSNLVTIFLLLLCLSLLCGMQILFSFLLLQSKLSFSLAAMIFFPFWVLCSLLQSAPSCHSCSTQHLLSFSFSWISFCLSKMLECCLVFDLIAFSQVFFFLISSINSSASKFLFIIRNCATFSYSCLSPCIIFNITCVSRPKHAEKRRFELYSTCVYLREIPGTSVFNPSKTPKNKYYPVLVKFEEL